MDFPGTTENTRIKKPLMDATERLKVLVVDDHRYFRESLVSFLEEFSAVDVAGTAGNGTEAVEMAGRLKPVMIIMDIQMPQMDGLEACMDIKKSSPEIRVVLYSMHPPEVYDDEALKRADRFVPKDRLFEELPGLIEKAMTDIGHEV